MENQKTTYIFRFRGYEPEFVQRRGESYIDYKLIYFNEQKELTEDEFNDYVFACQSSDSKRKLIDWIKQ